MKGECPECCGEITLAEDTMKGELVTCPDCGVELEVIEVDPLSFDLAPEEEEDEGE